MSILRSKLYFFKKIVYIFLDLCSCTTLVYVTIFSLSLLATAMLILSFLLGFLWFCFSFTPQKSKMINCTKTKLDHSCINRTASHFTSSPTSHFMESFEQVILGHFTRSFHQIILDSFPWIILTTHSGYRNWW